MTEIRCPQCKFSKEIDISVLPPNVNKVTCPKCDTSFSLPRREQAVVEGPQIPEPAPGIDTGRKFICHACGNVQTPTSHCTSCGATIVSTATEVPAQQYAGFWIRLIATILDGFLVFMLQAGLGGVLYLAGALNGSTGEGLGLLVEIFTLFLSIFYYIFFTGYCGQTPGKMAMRIKVVRCDGSPLTYGRAAFRELPAKFISGIILGIGYLMAAFDEHKQALHDRMAKTYVIKL